MQINEIAPAEAPMDLLLEADPSEAKVKGYLDRCTCLAAIIDGAVVGVCLLKPIGDDAYELMNISVAPPHQQRGIGTALLSHAIAWVRAMGANVLEVGTATFGYPLAFYQRQGFRASAIDRGFFLDNYPEPLFEDGIQHKDMLRLRLDLQR
jgi:GNAT superfamily N-acetyltransferase